MGHIIQFKSRTQYIEAVRVLEKLPGTWHCRGPSASPVLMVLESHYQALVHAGVISANGKKDTAHAEKTAAKKGKS
jgi:hypothetical protein